MEILAYDKPSSWELILAGDSHEGTRLQSRDGIEKLKEYVMDEKNRYMVFMGDEIEAITVDDPRFNFDTSAPSLPLQQAKNVVEDFKPIRKRILGWLDGNHPLKLSRYGMLTRDIVCQELDVPHGTWSAKFVFNDKHGVQFKTFATHGMRGSLTSQAKDFIQREANLKASLKVKLQRKAGDCALMACGHYHQLLVVEPSGELYLRDDGTKVRQAYLEPGTGDGYIPPDQRWYACTGSFYRLYGEMGVSGYSEIGGYDPVELGFVVATIEDRRIVNVRKEVV